MLLIFFVCFVLGLRWMEKEKEYKAELDRKEEMGWTWLLSSVFFLFFSLSC
jgi:hypothetical protein